ncbi:MAG: radical SAM family heme chaperone HemW [Bacteroidia bacterium]
MPGIYIHIPFCKQACHYCNFHFSTSLQYKNDFVSCLIKEIELQKNYLNGEKIDTIYFGGGTPSLLSYDDLMMIFEKLHQHFSINADAEITLESNPDDLSKQKIKELKRTPINRLSIGVQSFFDDDLQLMNRAHHADEAQRSVLNAADAGFENITIDLMYALPTLTDDKWKQNLQTAFSLPVQHLSCYNLTVEEQTALAKFIRQGKIPAVDEDRAVAQFKILIKAASEKGFEQYEISNFAKNEMYSRHNSSYWKGESYLGLGPSAHSYNGTSRQWNISNNQIYISSINKKELNFEIENLKPFTLYNEYVMTSLRTKWGVQLNQIESKFGKTFADYFKTNIAHFVNGGKVIQQQNNYRLSDEGKLMTDHIASEMFWVE